MCSRRQFLIRTAWLTLLSPTLKAFASERRSGDPPIVEFNSTDLETLVAVMDDIIPASDGMPPASMAGGVQFLQYLGWQYPAIQEEISRFLKILTETSDLSFRQVFQKLRPDQRAQVLASMEKTHTSVFSTFVGYVYESYYTNPRVLGLIWCSPSPPSIGDDEALLAPVRTLTYLYRERNSDSKRVDVLVIGSGAAGAAITKSLAEKGAKVVCLEQGDWSKPSDYPSSGFDYEAQMRRPQFSFSPNERKPPALYGRIRAPLQNFWKFQGVE